MGAKAAAAGNLIILCNLKDLKKVSITISSSTKHVTAPCRTCKRKELILLGIIKSSGYWQ